MTAHILIVEARYYGDVSDELAAGAIAELDAHDASYERVEVPGALELPQAMAYGLASGSFDGAVALGCVIRGETSHYDIVATESARMIMELAIGYGIPVGNGILTVDTFEQALVRAKKNGRNKGGVAAAACLATISVKSAFAAPGDD